MHGAVENCRGTIRYWKLERGFNKIESKNKEGYSNMLLDPYFSEIPNKQQSKLANNGWIGDFQSIDGFGDERDFHYLRRTINIWGDCIKLRYGNCPADSPYLWQHMSSYVTQMASVFDGFRLDNAHSTPIHVAQYLLNVARS